MQVLLQSRNPECWKPKGRLGCSNNASLRPQGRLGREHSPFVPVRVCSYSKTALGPCVKWAQQYHAGSACGHKLCVLQHCTWAPQLGKCISPSLLVQCRRALVLREERCSKRSPTGTNNSVQRWVRLGVKWKTAISRLYFVSLCVLSILMHLTVASRFLLVLIWPSYSCIPGPQALDDKDPFAWNMSRALLILFWTSLKSIPLVPELIQLLLS